MDYNPLHIHDSDESTEGGPPGWMVWSMIIGCVVMMVIFALVGSMLF